MNQKLPTNLTTLHRVAEDLPTLVMFILGAIILLLAGPRTRWLYALLYLAFCAFALLWFMRFICSHCVNAYKNWCPGVFGNIASKFFEQRSLETFKESFKRNIVVLYLCWLVPPIAALYQLVTNYTYRMLIALIAFSLVAFVILPLASKGNSCANCATRSECPRIKEGQNKSA